MIKQKKIEIKLKLIDEKSGSLIDENSGKYQSIVGEASQDSSLLDFLVEAKIQINHSCGGMGTCGTCLIEVENAELMGHPNEVELETKTARGLRQNERLACQNIPLNGLKIKIRI